MWDRFATTVPEIHHAQTGAWARAQHEENIDSFIAIAAPNGAGHEISGGAVVTVRTVRGVGRVGYVDHGPVFATEHDRAAALTAVIESAQSQRLAMLILQPADDDFATGPILRRRGFGSTHIKTSLGATVKTDLGHRDPDRLLASMKPKTRSNIRKSLRSPLTFRSTTESADVDVFHELLTATGMRQGFEAPSRSFLKRVVDNLAGRGWAQVMLVEHDGCAVSGMLAITVGSSLVYKRGAWSGAFGEYRPNEFMHWGALNWAIAAGCTTYDFDGLELDTATSLLQGGGLPNHAVTSVDRFKLGFGGDPVLLPDVLTFVSNPVARIAHDRIFPTVAQNKTVKRQIKRMRKR